MIDRRLSVAPMMDCTDRHYRYFLRLALKRTLLYSEMVVARALVEGNHRQLLDFSTFEQPLGLQLGGCDPETLAKAARIGERWGYQEINLNVGCPSDRVKAARFGVCLMKEPTLVKDCVQAMKAAVDLPVTVKCRVGVDDYDSFECLRHFSETVHAGGCTTLIIHARKAWLKGLNPRQNRHIPPLNHERVYALKQALPHLEIIMNGGMKTPQDVLKALEHLDGVMIGRPAYYQPMSMLALERAVHSSSKAINEPGQWLRAYLPYIAKALAEGHSASRLSGHLLGLFQDFPGAKHWRRYVCEKGRDPAQCLTVLERAADQAFSQAEFPHEAMMAVQW